jgi:hypothetical protein
MTAEVVDLHGKRIIEPGFISTALVEELEDLLERAKSGEVIGAVIAKHHGDHACSWILCGVINSYGVAGAMASAQKRLLEHIES